MTATAATLFEIEGGTVSELEVPGEFEQEGEGVPSYAPTGLEGDYDPMPAAIDQEPVPSPTLAPAQQVDPPTPTPSPMPEPTPSPEQTSVPEPTSEPTPSPEPTATPDVTPAPAP